MAGLVRQRLLATVFGGGVAGAVASSGATWIWEQAREALGGEPERLDVARLAPGETYLVTTRPPMGRAERRLDARARSLQAALAEAERPSRRTRRVALRLAKAQRTESRARTGSRRQRRATARAERLGPRFDRLTAPTPRQERQRVELERTRAELARHREAALAAARGSKRRRPVERRLG